jgi:hypothetical protein
MLAWSNYPLPDHATSHIYAAFDEPQFYAEAMRSADAQMAWSRGWGDGQLLVEWCMGVGRHQPHLEYPDGPLGFQIE